MRPARQRIVEIRDAHGGLIAWVRASELPLRGYDPASGHEIFLATCSDPERVYSALAESQRLRNAIREAAEAKPPRDPRPSPITLEDLGL